ncbi:MAG: hypothetical protein E7K72_00795 [Roseomonas mucosa]|nr:hypothetical protein [Roseomonas mucosa]
MRSAGRLLAGSVRVVLALLRTLVAALAGMIVAALLLAVLNLSDVGWPAGSLRDAAVPFAGLVAGALALPGDLRRAGLLHPRRPSR